LKGGREGPIFQADLCTCARTVSTTTIKFGELTHMESSIFLGDHHSSITRGRGASVSKLFGTSYMR